MNPKVPALFPTPMGKPGQQRHKPLETADPPPPGGPFLSKDQDPAQKAQPDTPGPHIGFHPSILWSLGVEEPDALHGTHPDGDRAPGPGSKQKGHTVQDRLWPAQLGTKASLFLLAQYPGPQSLLSLLTFLRAKPLVMW